MASITLNVLRCPDSATPETRQASGGELVLGRGNECDWQLADPDRVLSKRHCSVEYFGGGWQLRDLSTNGTFVNHAASPVGRDQVKALMDGDRLRLGSYEIEVRIAEESAAAGPGWGSSRADPFAPVAADPLPFGGTPRATGGGLLPDDFDPFADSPAPMPDHAPSTAEAFLVPPSLPAGKSVIPDDWDFGLTPKASPAPKPVTPPVAPPTAIGPDPFDEPPPRPLPTPVIAPPPRPATGENLSALATLQVGAGLPATPHPNPDAALAAAGAMLRAAVAGLRALLIARADVKREFRIEQTMLRAANNNPLKFAATDEAATAALLDPRTPALKAVQETVDDLTAHQVAALAATQAAARALLEKLAPAALEADDPGGGILPGAREKRLWEAYRKRHALLVEQFEDDFDSAFGKAFARAYEQATGKRHD